MAGDLYKTIIIGPDVAKKFCVYRVQNFGAQFEIAS
jgi:hypothetical protein